MSEQLNKILETLDSAIAKAVEDLEWLEGDTTISEAEVCLDWIEELEHIRGLVNNGEES